MDACLRGVFQTGISMVWVRVRSQCDLRHESWSKKNLSSWATRRWSRMILRSLVLTHCQRVTDKQTDTPPVAKSRCNIAERDKNWTALHMERLLHLRKNAPTLASSSFDKHGLILIIFGQQHQHTFKNDAKRRIFLVDCWRLWKEPVV